MELSDLGITPQKQKQFFRKGIETAEDLIRYLPRAYQDFTKETGILPEDALSCLTVHVNSFRTYYGRVETLKAQCTVKDTGETLTVTWFNQNYRRELLQSTAGKDVYVAGRVRRGQRAGSYELSAPELFTAELARGKQVVPVYSRIPGMSSEYLRAKLRLAADCAPLTQETLPAALVAQLGLLPMRAALTALHFPQSMEEVRRGRERLLFDDLLYFALHQAWAAGQSAAVSPFPLRDLHLMEALREKLPYTLTDDQRAAVDEMLEDIRQGRRLNALVQGDVGCGKTAVAFLMMAALAGSGYQTVLMAPTQVLARQHYAELSALLTGLSCEAVYLGSELKAAARREALKKIAGGAAGCIVGTHAVLGREVTYSNLALTVADEEHRFGVAQRRALVEKAAGGVHSITMSATPIPRSLAQAVYGNAIQLHTIRTMPAGRQPVKTGIAVSRARVYRYLLSQIRQGRQAYVVCPMIDPSETREKVKSVAEISAEYRAALSPCGVRIATLTGRDPKADTERVLADFRNGALDILIATTVIEVGVNVPNATVIVICSADRFGLSSLHQLRGRVGRSPLPSVCVLECDGASEKARERLEVLCRTSNGFEIAEADLQMRGAGDFLGTRQSGDNKYLALMLAYPEQYRQAQQIAAGMLARGDDCPLLQRVAQEQDTAKS